MLAELIAITEIGCPWYGPGQVEAAGRVCEVGAEPVAGDRVSDFAGRGA